MANKPPFDGELVRLGDVCKVEKATITKSNDKVWLLNLDAIEKNTGRILTMSLVSPQELGSSTIAFSNHAVLYSKLRPNLNKVVIPKTAGVATSEILPLIPNEKRLSRKYLACFLRSKAFVAYAIASTVGAKMPRVTRKTVLDCMIPLPNLNDQAIVAKELLSITGAIELCEVYLTKLDSLVKSRFVEMFGDPVDGRKWPRRKLKSVYTVKSSKRIYAREQAKNGVPFYRLADINSLIDIGSADSGLYISEYRYNELLACGQVPVAGDILVTARGTLGRCYVISPDDRFYFQDGMITWLSQTKESPIPVYLKSVFADTHFITELRRNCSGTTVKYLSISDLAKVTIPLPPISLQREFADFAARVDKLRVEAEKQKEGLQTLYDTLAQDYFAI